MIENARTTSTRAGRYVRQPTGYSAFIPAPLPPDPPLQLGPLVSILSKADLAIGRLDGVGRTLPNPDLFVAMYVRKEAVLSSQIEGTQSSLDDLVILDASCSLEEDNPRELAQRMQKQWIVKKAAQPMGHQSAGCVFKNPRGASAGDLIERLYAL